MTRPAHAAPFHFARRDELVDHHLRAVREIAELRFPDHELARARKSHSRIRTEHGLFGKERIDDHEIALLLGDVLQRHIRALVPALAILIVQHRVAMKERAAAAVLARDPDRIAFIQQRREREMLGHAPVERQLAARHQPAVVHDLLHARMELEVLGNGGDPLAQPFSVSSGSRVSSCSFHFVPL